MQKLPAASMPDTAKTAPQTPIPAYSEAPAYCSTIYYTFYQLFLQEHGIILKSEK